jgi:RNA polymerase-binding transcription factor DksA
MGDKPGSRLSAASGVTMAAFNSSLSRNGNAKGSEGLSYATHTEKSMQERASAGSDQADRAPQRATRMTMKAMLKQMSCEMVPSASS